MFLSGILDEKVSPVDQKTSIHKCKKKASCNDPSASVINFSSSQSNEIFMDIFNNVYMNTDDIKVVAYGEKNDQPKVFILEDEKKRQYGTLTKKVSVSYVNHASTSQQQSCNPHKGVVGDLSGHDNQAKEDADLLSSFIALRTKSSLGHNESKHEENIVSQGNNYFCISFTSHYRLHARVYKKASRR